MNEIGVTTKDVGEVIPWPVFETKYPPPEIETELPLPLAPFDGAGAGAVT